MIVTGVAWYLSARVGLLAGEVGGNISPLWPPTGVALAALIVFGVRVWPGILIALVVLELSLVPQIPALVTTAGSALAPLAAYGMLRWTGFRASLDRLRDALALVFLGAFAAMLISSTVGAAMRVYAGQLSLSEFWPVWWVWWTGDAMGVLVLTPFLLSLRTLRWSRATPWYRPLEGTALIVGSFAATLIGARSLGVLFVAFPFIGWAALRFQLAGAAPCALAISLAAVYASVSVWGPFAGSDLPSRMVILQLFNGMVVLGALFLAVVTVQRDRARLSVERTCERLGDVIEHIDSAETTLDITLPHQSAQEQANRRAALRPAPRPGPKPPPIRRGRQRPES